MRSRSRIRLIARPRSLSSCLPSSIYLSALSLRPRRVNTSGWQHAWLACIVRISYVHRLRFITSLIQEKKTHEPRDSRISKWLSKTRGAIVIRRFMRIIICNAFNYCIITAIICDYLMFLKMIGDYLV